jgi:hypothetical protein
VEEETKANKTSQGGMTQHKLESYWLQLMISLTDYSAFWMIYDVLCENMWLQGAVRTEKNSQRPSVSIINLLISVYPRCEAGILTTIHSCTVCTGEDDLLSEPHRTTIIKPYILHLPVY